MEKMNAKGKAGSNIHKNCSKSQTNGFNTTLLKSIGERVIFSEWL